MEKNNEGLETIVLSGPGFESYLKMVLIRYNDLSKPAINWDAAKMAINDVKELAQNRALRL